MKNYILPFLLLLAMACTKTEFIDVIKTVHDTVKTTSYIDRVFNTTDTVETIVPRVVEHRDTVFLHDTVTQIINTQTVVYDTIVTVDSLFIERTTYLHDTIYTPIWHYGDTLYILFGRSTYRVPEELQLLVSLFFTEAQKRGLHPQGGLLNVTYWKDAPPGWYSFTIPSDVQYQWEILVVDNLPVKYLMTPLFRELARNQLGKKYSAGDDIMNVSFDPTKVWHGSANEKQYLDALFK